MAAALVVLWNTAIYFDSSALTAGTVQVADKELRGATMGLHSMWRLLAIRRIGGGRRSTPRIGGSLIG